MNVLLHACCGPCMTAFNEYFLEKNIDYSVYYYNPNIHPYKEYLRRFDTLSRYTDSLGVETIHEPSFMQSYWENNFTGKDAQDRCTFCYKKRLYGTARAASERGFTHFTSTLLISPYQDHEKIKSIGIKAALEYGVEFLYEDFRPYFRRGQNIAREEGLYRQKYCGCIFSYRESKFIEKIKWD